MKRAEASAPAPLLLLGTVRGQEAEAPRVREALETFRPGAVALGLSPEEVRALEQHFSDPYIEPWVPLSSTEMSYARGLSRFGPARVPSPAFLEVLRWAQERDLTVHGVEPPDDQYSELFLEHVGYFDLLRRTLAERSLRNDPPDVAQDAEDYAVHWESRAQKGSGSERLGRARAGHVSERLSELRAAGRSPDGRESLKNRVVLVVDVERFGPVLTELVRGGWKDLRERASSRGAEGRSVPP